MAIHENSHFFPATWRFEHTHSHSHTHVPTCRATAWDENSHLFLQFQPILEIKVLQFLRIQLHKTKQTAYININTYKYIMYLNSCANSHLKMIGIYRTSA